MDEFISIGQAARLLGVHPDTLRLWEKNGQIKPVRTKGNHRRYRVTDIREMQKDHAKYAQWDELLSDDKTLNKWLYFYEDHDPVFAEAMAYAKTKTSNRDLSLKFILVAVLNHQVLKRTKEWKDSNA